jgi:hypothetical protein
MEDTQGDYNQEDEIKGMDVDMGIEALVHIGKILTFYL